jgi:hypothetical protein
MWGMGPEAAPEVWLGVGGAAEAVEGTRPPQLLELLLMLATSPSTAPAVQEEWLKTGWEAIGIVVGDSASVETREPHWSRDL